MVPRWFMFWKFIWSYEHNSADQQAEIVVADDEFVESGCMTLPFGQIKYNKNVTGDG